MTRRRRRTVARRRMVATALADLGVQTVRKLDQEVGRLGLARPLGFVQCGCHEGEALRFGHRGRWQVDHQERGVVPERGAAVPYRHHDRDEGAQAFSRAVRTPLPTWPRRRPRGPTERAWALTSWRRWTARRRWPSRSANADPRMVLRGSRQRGPVTTGRPRNDKSPSIICPSNKSLSLGTGARPTYRRPLAIAVTVARPATLPAAQGDWEMDAAATAQARPMARPAGYLTSA